MSHVALARKWRPQKFEDVIGQRGVVDTLRNAIASGPPGAVVHLCGAARRRQDDHRAHPGARAQLRQRAHRRSVRRRVTPASRSPKAATSTSSKSTARPTPASTPSARSSSSRSSIAPMRDRYKIFIIDEVHRLSKNAFDALLKSIEEPPPYVKFMMATTELDTVPVTIQSRSQVFELKALPFSSIREQLRARDRRAKASTIDDARAGAGGAVGRRQHARRAVARSIRCWRSRSDRVTADDVSTVLGLIGRDVQFDIAETVAREDAVAAFALAGTVVDRRLRSADRVPRTRAADARPDGGADRPDAPGAIPRSPPKTSADRCRRWREHYSREDLMRAFDLLSTTEYEIRQSSQPRHTFEMVLLKWIHLRQLTPLTELIAAVGQRPRRCRLRRPARLPRARTPRRPAARCRSHRPRRAACRRDRRAAVACPHPSTPRERRTSRRCADSAGPRRRSAHHARCPTGTRR